MFAVETGGSGECQWRFGGSCEGGRVCVEKDLQIMTRIKTD